MKMVLKIVKLCGFKGGFLRLRSVNIVGKMVKLDEKFFMAKAYFLADIIGFMNYR